MEVWNIKPYAKSQEQIDEHSKTEKKLELKMIPDSGSTSIALNKLLSILEKVYLKAQL